MNKKNNLTTIAVYSSTKDGLDALKVHPNQSYDELLQELIKIAQQAKEV